MRHFDADLIEISLRRFFANKVFFIFVQFAFKNRENNTHCTPSFSHRPIANYHRVQFLLRHLVAKVHLNRGCEVLSVCLSVPFTFDAHFIARSKSWDVTVTNTLTDSSRACAAEMAASQMESYQKYASLADSYYGKIFQRRFALETHDTVNSNDVFTRATLC